MKKLTVLPILLILLIPSVFALNVPENQQTIDITLERGKEYSFSLLLRNFTEVTTINSTSDWLMFGEDNKEEIIITDLVNQSLEVTVFVPSNAEEKEHVIEIKGNSVVISTLRIDVIRPLADKMNDMNSRMNEIDSRQDDLESRMDDVIGRITNLANDMDTLETKSNELKSLIEDVKEKQDNLTALEEMVADLENQTAELEKKNEELSLTGNITAGMTSVYITVGIIIGIVAAFLFLNRREITNKFNRPRSVKPSSGEKPFRFKMR